MRGKKVTFSHQDPKIYYVELFDRKGTYEIDAWRFQQKIDKINDIISPCIRKKVKQIQMMQILKKS